MDGLLVRPEGHEDKMGKGLMVGALAGVGFYLANEFVPTTKSNLLDNVINVVAAAVTGAAAAHFLHRK